MTLIEWFLCIDSVILFIVMLAVCGMNSTTFTKLNQMEINMYHIMRFLKLKERKDDTLTGYDTGRD